MKNRRKKFVKKLYQPVIKDVVDVQFVETATKDEHIEHTQMETAPMTIEYKQIEYTPEPKPEQIENKVEPKTEVSEPENRSPKEVIDSIVATLFSKVDSQLYRQLIQLEKSLKNPGNKI